LVDVGKLTPASRQGDTGNPRILEAVRGRDRFSMVAEMILAELAGVVTLVEQKLRYRRGARLSQEGLPGSCGGIMPVRSGCIPVKKALRPAVQLCSA